MFSFDQYHRSYVRYIYLAVNLFTLYLEFTKLISVACYPPKEVTVCAVQLYIQSKDHESHDDKKLYSTNSPNVCC